jgi:hypothetical protein
MSLEFAEVFMVDATAPRRFRISIRAVMIAVALFALALTPIIWMYRRTEELIRMERIAADHARLQAERAQYLANLSAANAALVGTGSGTTAITRSGSTAAKNDPLQTKNLWAGLSVNRAVFQTGEAKDLRIELTLVNDSDAAVDPKIAESQIVIKGKELGDPAKLLSSLPKDARFQALPPGDSLQFGLGLGDQIQQPGTYRIIWKGAGFESPEIVVRILADKKR